MPAPLTYFKRYPGRLVIVWSESPAIQRFFERLEHGAVSRSARQGKVARAGWRWATCSAEEKVDYIAFQDADVVNFSREMLARLILPALDPIVDFDFVKAYYARVSDRLHGRVTRLFLAPLLAAFTRLLGQDPYIRYLASFRYALSGEFAVQRDLASRMRLPSDWGLEIVTLFEVLRHRAPARICQVEIADRYDHKHQDLSADDPTRGLNRMACDVGTHLLRTLAAAGVVLSDGLLESLLAAYQREAEDAVADSYAVAMINGLAYDRHAEEVNVQTFIGALRGGHRRVSQRPAWVLHLCPNWARVWAGLDEAGPLAPSCRAPGPDIGLSPRKLMRRDQDKLLLVVSDLDGTLLDTLRIRSVPRARLSTQSVSETIPLVLATSKTLAEVRTTRGRNWRRSDPDSGEWWCGPHTSRAGGRLSHVASRVVKVTRFSIEMGVPRDVLVRELAEIAAETGIELRGLNQLSTAVISQLTGLSHEASLLACDRAYDEPFLLEREDQIALIAAVARRRGLLATRGGRFCHLSGPTDKGFALAWILRLFGDIGEYFYTIGLGDAPNDLPFLQLVDRPIIIPSRDDRLDPQLAAALPHGERASDAGTVGWNDAVLAVLAGRRLTAVTAALHD